MLRFFFPASETLTWNMSFPRLCPISLLSFRAAQHGRSDGRGVRLRLSDPLCVRVNTSASLPQRRLDVPHRERRSSCSPPYLSTRLVVFLPMKQHGVKRSCLDFDVYML